jgi:hypothetical protein
MDSHQVERDAAKTRPNHHQQDRHQYGSPVTGAQGKDGNPSSNPTCPNQYVLGKQPQRPQSYINPHPLQGFSQGRGQQAGLAHVLQGAVVQNPAQQHGKEQQQGRGGPHQPG